MYGKMAQSVGTPPFQSWIWAGLITSQCRSMLLAMLCLHHDRANMLMVATDGVYTRERIVTPLPRDTGTFGVPKPLGGWEEKECPNGIFACRPGIYFALGEHDEDKLITARGRGLGPPIIQRSWKEIRDAFESGKDGIELDRVNRFIGAKSALTTRGVQAKTYHRSETYGEWIDRVIKVQCNPRPKRERINSDGTLALRSAPLTLESEPYDRAVASEEALELRCFEDEAEEQPEGEYV